ncbi:cysteine desulfurase family protein [Sphingomonas sp.]|uniref:cysteine desulfurase family protein n=1 Tax=Sphingomonas sp. TaxID=28214 RepID=UPI0035AF7B13
MTRAAREAVARGFSQWANPSSPHAEGRAARRMVEDARADVGAAYGWGNEVLLTGGASESLAIVLGRAMVERCFVSAVEHDAVLRAAGAATVMAVDARGQVVLPDLAGPRALVAVQWANSETGVRQPIAALAEAVHGAGHLLLVDAAQMPAGADAEVAEHADFVALSAHKRGGPPGIGALLVRDLATLLPIGGQERGYRPGTENMPAAIGYAAALAEAEPDHGALRAHLDDAVRRSGGIVVAEDSLRHPAIGAYRMPGVASAAQLIRFDSGGIAVSAGSACASGSLKPSHVLAALGWADDAAREVVRVSFGRTTTREEVDRFITAWRGIARGRA